MEIAGVVPLNKSVIFRSNKGSHNRKVSPLIWDASIESSHQELAGFENWLFQITGEIVVATVADEAGRQDVFRVTEGFGKDVLNTR
jgi:hypothetical protein